MKMQVFSILKIQVKTPALDSLIIKATGLSPATLLKKDSSTGVLM